MGLGWTLFAGGVITRSVNDKLDEYNSNFYGANVGYYYNYNVLNTSSWNQRTYLRSIAQSSLSWLYDTSPDEFSFNFADYSGKFYLDHTGNWAVQCNKPIKVTFNGTFLNVPFSSSNTDANSHGYPPCFNGFSILTENGTEYVFGGNTNAIDFSINFFGQSSSNWIATAWYLTKIKLPSKQVIIQIIARNISSPSLFKMG